MIPAGLWPEAPHRVPVCSVGLGASGRAFRIDQESST